MKASTLTIDLSQISLIGEQVTFHDDWADAIEHVAAVTGTERGFLWFRPGTRGLLVFEDSEAATHLPMACILNPREFQAARSEGVLEDLAFSPAHIVLRGLTDFAGPKLAPRPGGHNNSMTAMKTSPSKPVDKPEPSKGSVYIVARPVVFRAKRCAAGSRIEVDPAKLGKEDRRKLDTYALQGWVRLATQEEIDAPSAGEEVATPPTQEPELSAAVAPKIAEIVGSAEAPLRVQLVPLGEIEPDPTQPRKDFNPEKMAEDVQSVKEHGILQPIMLRLVDGRKMIVYGERRWRMAQMAEQSVVPAFVRVLTDRQAAEIQGIENLGRDDLKPMEEATQFRKLLNLPDYKMEDLEKLTGLKRNTLYGKLKLLELSDSMQKAVQTERVSASVAETIGRLPEELREKAETNVLRAHGGEGEVTVQVVKRIVDNLKEDAKWKKAMAEIKAQAKNKGLRLVDGDPSRPIIDYSGEVSPSCGYVGANDKCPRDPNGRRWSQVLKDQPGIEQLATTKGGRYRSGGLSLVLIYEREQANAALKRLGLWQAEGSKASKERDAARRKKEKHGRDTEQMHEHIDELQRRAEGDGPQGAMLVLRALTEALIRTNSEAAFFVAKRRAIVSADESKYSGKAQRELVKLVGAAAAKHDCGLATELAVAALAGSMPESSYYRQGIKKVADWLGVVSPELEGSADVRTGAEHPGEAVAA